MSTFSSCGQLADERLAIGGRACLEVVLDDLDEVRLVLRREDVAGLRVGAQRHDHVAERLFAIGDLLRIVGPLEGRDLALGLVVNLHVGVDALLELERRGALRVDGLAVGGDRGTVHGRRGPARSRCRGALCLVGRAGHRALLGAVHLAARDREDGSERDGRRD